MSAPVAVPPSNGKTVVVSGINGYIASVTGLEALRKGYTLVGTCRSRAKAEPLLKGAYAEFADAGRVRIVEVVDMTKEGAFDEAVKGAHAIIHTASPIDFTLKTPSQVISPAIAGTVGILHSALRHAGPQLSALAVTSSVAAIASPKPDGSSYTFTEEDWNNYAEKQVEEAGGVDIPPNILYGASKTAAERAIWAFREKEKASTLCRSVSPRALNPTVVYGPPIISHSDPASLNETIKPIYAIFSGTITDGELPAKIGTGAYVDVRDVAAAHVWAIENPAASDGQRYIVAAGLGPPQAIADLIREVYPERGPSIPLGNPGEGYVKGEYGWFPAEAGGIALSAKKLEEAMGIKWIKFDKCILDTVKCLEKYL
ncbi:hypothetical protein GP486_002365 [Trichoglossum hirsutum]|uniref:NAD-dependent epimerase/dehydratase domain-containing protein n=1 Tax=Trichoglossum hirsutum TaxID=265104 RepID=A0A9P8LEF1_9PEZI|nr:hypothetical protein GP486_002365 [Trichoglossum hirsutum]